MNLVRWLLMIPAAVIAWYVAIVLGLLVLLGVDAVCPAEQMVSDACVAPWYDAVSSAVMCLGAALAAILILTTCTLLAPSHKRQVAIATFVLGAAAASLMGLETEAYGPMLTALIAGALALWVLVRRLPNPHSTVKEPL